MTDKPTTQTTQDFLIADVIGAITGRLLGKMDGIYQVSQFMAGEPVWTHQLSRVVKEICPAVLRQHPQLAPVMAEVEAVNPDNWQDMLAGWISRFGETLALSPMMADEHQRIDPLSEIAEKVHPDRIIAVQQ